MKNTNQLSHYPPEILPRKEEDQNKKVSVMVRLPQYVLDEVALEAKQRGLKNAEWIRCLIFDNYFKD